MLSVNRKGLDFYDKIFQNFYFSQKFLKAKIELPVKNFTSKAEFQSHNDNFHGFKVFNENQEEKQKYKQNLAQSRPRHVQYNVPKCHYCDILFESRDELDAHMVSEHMENPYHCLICGKGVSFPKRNLLREHQLEFHDGKMTKDDKTEWPCDIPGCKYVGSTRKLLWTHKRRQHIKSEKSWKCDQCDYASNSKGNLVMHQELVIDIALLGGVFKLMIARFRS